MNILLYNPDNEVTNNYMPHLWMFVLQAVTPPEHRVFLIDGNAQPMTEKEIARFIRANDIELAGIGAMIRMAEPGVAPMSLKPSPKPCVRSKTDRSRSASSCFLPCSSFEGSIFSSSPNANGRGFSGVIGPA